MYVNVCSTDVQVNLILTVPSVANTRNPPNHKFLLTVLESAQTEGFCLHAKKKVKAFTRLRSSFSVPGDDRDESISEM